MRKAFTMVELLVVIGIIAVLVTILVPTIMSGLRRSKTTVCQRNLGVIGSKYNDYAKDARYDDMPFPRHLDDLDTRAEIQANPNLYRTTDRGLTIAGGDVLDATVNLVRKGDLRINGIGECGMQTVWVLIAEGMLGENAFKCPGDDDYEVRKLAPDAAPRARLKRYGWTSLKQFSYGIHWPYTADDTGRINPADPMDKKRRSSRFVYRENMPLLADRNPGGAVVKGMRGHSNHPGNDGGCIVVSRIGNTTFHRPGEDPAIPGTYLYDSKVVFGDDIYIDQATVEDGTADLDEFPQNADDTVITPVISRMDDPA